MRSFSNTTTSNEPLNLFFSYSHKDEPLRDHLERHLAAYKRNDKIQTWHDRKILPGGNWQKEIDDAINQANLILLLVSAHFIESNYCYGIEMVRAIQRHEEGDATVIPIMLAPVFGWDQTPMASLLALPTDAKPVSRWRSRDEAFFDVAQGIARIVRCRAPGKVEWKLILEGSASALPEGFSKSLESTLQDLAADASLRILSMAEGSLILGLQSSPQEVIAGKRFAPLRQMLSAMVLAAWYRGKLGPYLKGFLDSNDTGKYGLDVVEPDNSTIDEYLRLYKTGIWRTVTRHMNSESGVITTRTIIAGGLPRYGQDIPF